LFSRICRSDRPIGSVKTAAGPLIAVVKGGIVAVLYMELIRARTLLRLVAGAGLVFVAVLFALSLVDVLSRVLATP
jgi:cytochrome c oxidase subunit 4